VSTEDDARILQCRVGGDATEIFTLVPHDDLRLGDAERESGVAPQVLVGEEEHAAAARKGPSQHLCRVG